MSDTATLSPEINEAVCWTLEPDYLRAIFLSLDDPVIKMIAVRKFVHEVQKEHGLCQNQNSDES